MKKVFVFGGATYDSIVYLDNFPAPEPVTIHRCRFNESVGSTGSGKSVTLSKLGFDVTLHAVIGDDIYGKKIIDYLNQPNLHFLYDFDLLGTERHVNLMNKNGERISIFVNNFSDYPAVDFSKFDKYLTSSDFVIVNIINYCRKFLPFCKKRNVPVWTDLHDYDGKNPYHQDFIDASDYIFLSSDNFKDYRSFMEKQIDAGKKLVVCTHGKKGASALTRDDGWIDIPILDIFEMKDTNGAGDAFFSGFLYGFSKNYSTRKCMEMATIAGGLCISSLQIASENLNVDLLEKIHQENYSIR